MIGIVVDTTGSTPLPVDAKNRPLALDPKLKKNLAAHAWLWKDHTGADEAAAITETARKHAPEYIAPIGGVYSSEGRGRSGAVKRHGEASATRSQDLQRQPRIDSSCRTCAALI